MEIYEGTSLPRLFPALEPVQRLHLELHGYVVIEGVLTRAEIERLTDSIYAIETDARAGRPPAPPATVHAGGHLYFRVDNLVHLGPSFLAYATHPLLWGSAEEMIGGEARLEQSDFSIHRRGEDGRQEGLGLHRGAFDGMAFSRDGLYHFPFVKALTMLTDVDEDDGGTVVVPGSHKLHGLDVADVTRIARQDPALTHQVTARAGSTMLFYESTIHASGPIRSDRDRVYIVTGYSAPMYQPWHEYDPDPEWIESLPQPYRPFVSGSNRWLWKPRIRNLTDPPQSLDEARREAAAAGVAASERSEETRSKQEALARIQPD